MFAKASNFRCVNVECGNGPGNNNKKKYAREKNKSVQNYPISNDPYFGQIN